MEFELGQTYAGYKFLDVVRRSRNAVHYRVQNTLAQRVEGLRALTGAAGDDPDAAESFLREVRIRARLSHPHIVTFYTAVPIEGRMAMTTELPDSVSLAERLRLGPLAWREAIGITRQLLAALACIHQQSFVHCDITPENILFGVGGFCKLADFSLARPLDPAHNAESGAVVGNPRYISPEQVKGERHLDQRSDLYSLGVVLYEMLCGRPRSQFELMMAHVNQAPVPPSHRQAKVPEFLDAVVLKALAKDAGDRYPSATAFADAIADLIGKAAGGESVERETSAAVDVAAVHYEAAFTSSERAPAIAEAAEVPEAATVLSLEA
ncbi:MAG: serine/threonine-protein kinase, partial [Candidatus Solibacter sp.]|nr:serine/threonine-protein kinase [Candidatus Solibacter sp.]